ncbi:L-dopachrome tautomerase yellow-f2-like isoform X1 [Lutzomyia longipalpis]|uniref:L-dopachrome tautomerase yellow-f2-like isoform X1 n=1 Tax=Lutzomyia longipalpis TaxID=7200 RepID=UPI0024845A65|nr:L-dopachrome tautomerase yellow-f2-like isoform X1 [Lutzomyia longipalpis]
MLVVFGVVLSVITSGINCGYSGSSVEEVFKWKRVIYENLPKSENSWVGPYRYYIPENQGVNSFGYHPSSGLFIVTMVRFRPGIPTSLGAFCVQENAIGSSPRIWGFPNYQINALRDSDFASGSAEEAARNAWKKPNKYYYSNGSYYANPQYLYQEKPSGINYGDYYDNSPRIISVFHVNVDEHCNRVFFVDNGQLVYYSNTTYTIQKPALWVIDLPVNGCETRNFPIIRRTELPDRIAAKAPNGYMHITLDYQSKNSCDDLFVYIANTFFSYLIVYDYKKDEFWLFDHETFKPVVAESHFVFEETFKYDMPLGLHNLVLGYPDKEGGRTAYYNDVASTAQYAVSTKILKNRRKSPINFNSKDFHIVGYRGCDHEPLKTVIDYTYGVMFNTEVQSNELRCWNMNKPLNPDNIGVISKSEDYTFPIQAFIDSRGYLWFGSTQIPILFASDEPLDLSKFNSIIFRVKASDAIRGTVCENL